MHKLIYCVMGKMFSEIKKYVCYKHIYDTIIFFKEHKIYFTEKNFKSHKIKVI